MKNPQLERQREIIRDEYNDLKCMKELKKDAQDRAVSELRRGKFKGMKNKF